MTSFEESLDQREWKSWVAGGDAEKYDTRNPIVGVLVDIAQFPDQFNPGDVTVLVLRVDDGSHIGVWLNKTVLRNEVEKLKPQWGETIGIKDLGEQLARDGQTKYHGYTVRVKRDLADRPPIQWGETAQAPAEAPIPGPAPAPVAPEPAPAPADPEQPVAVPQASAPPSPQPPQDDDIPF